MQYAKLENGYLIPAPGEVRQGGMVIMNPGPEILGPLGYKPVEYAERPEVSTPGNELREAYTDERRPHHGDVGGILPGTGAGTLIRGAGRHLDPRTLLDR